MFLKYRKNEKFFIVIEESTSFVYQTDGHLETSEKFSHLMSQQKNSRKETFKGSYRNSFNNSLSPTCYKSRNRRYSWRCFWNKYLRDFDGVELGKTTR
jgi:hypothetical protein